MNNIANKIGVGLVVLAIPTVALVNNSLTSRSKLTIKSNYLVEKGYSNCGHECSEIEKGYKWAKDTNNCDAKYSVNSSKYFNVGVVARAWDECAYSNNNAPI